MTEERLIPIGGIVETDDGQMMRCVEDTPEDISCETCAFDKLHEECWKYTCMGSGPSVHFEKVENIFQEAEHLVEGVEIYEQDYEELGRQIGAFTQEKQTAYGNSFGKAGDFLKLLYPDGIKPEQYGDALTLVRIFDKQMRIATDKSAFGESPYRDITGYGLLGTMKDESEEG